jgi:hypothetical protein
MPQFSLIPHPDYPPKGVQSVTVRVGCNEIGLVDLEYSVDSTAKLVIPDWQPGARADELWQTTCFELFLKRPDAEGYLEFNFSPSGKWAGYEFDGYRTGMRNSAAEDPDIMVFQEPGFFLEAEPWPSELVSGRAYIGLSAMIVELDGTRSFWALRHPPGKPDFHHPDCFALELPAPSAA